MMCRKTDKHHAKITNSCSLKVPNRPAIRAQTITSSINHIYQLKQIAMNNHEISKTNTYHRLNIFIGDNTSVYSAFLPFNDEAVLFNGNVLDLDQLIALEKDGTAGITNAKDAAKLDMAAFWSSLAKGGKAYAIKQGDLEMKAALNYTKPKIFNSTDSESKGICNAIKTVPNDNLTALLPYNIDAPKITAGETLITVFHGYIGKQQSAEGALTVVGKSIDAKMVLLDENIEVMLNLLELIDPPNPDFVAGFIENTEIEDVGIRHTIFEGYMYIAQTTTPIITGTVKIVDIDRSANTDNLGQFRIEQFRNGTYIVEFTAPGFVKQTSTITFKRGETLGLDVFMVAG